MTDSLHAQLVDLLGTEPSEEAVDAAVKWERDDAIRWLKQTYHRTQREAELLVGEALTGRECPDYRRLLRAALRVLRDRDARVVARMIRAVARQGAVCLECSGTGRGEEESAYNSRVGYYTRIPKCSFCEGTGKDSKLVRVSLAAALRAAKEGQDA